VIDITEVRAGDGGALAAAELNAPAAGDRIPTYALELRGLAVSKAEPVTAVELVSDGAAAGRAPLDVERPRAAAAHDTDARIGFRALLNGLLLPSDFQLDLQAVTVTGERVPFAMVRGRREPLPPGSDAPPQPLMLTTLGRTGSMLLQRLLEAHPEILVLRPHRYEQRVAGYWVEVLLALTEPSGYMRQLAPAGSLDDPRWWLGDEGPPAHTDPADPLHRWLGREAVVSLADLCRSRIDALYAQAAAQAGGPEPLYFAEKHTLRSAALTAELYPGAREIFLVRDFRDMVASILAFNRKRGVRGFGEGAAAGEADYVDRLAGWATNLVRSWERRSSSAHLVRYEDLVAAPDATLSGLLAYLGVDASAATVSGMREAVTDEMPELAGHETSADAAASIGRWRRDLADEVQEASARSFREALAAFGYEP
jgi:Sulfotransferase family